MEASVPFYAKHSNFRLTSALRTTPTAGDFPLLLDHCAPLFPSEVTVANSDFSLVQCDLTTSKVLGTFQQGHTDKVNALRYAGVSDNEHLAHAVITASSDKTVKLWDRRTGTPVADLKHQNQPFYSVDTNKQLICAGGHSEVVFWDLRKLKVALDYRDSHTDDVTAVRFHPRDPQ